VSGIVESYDAAARTLTVKGSKATWTFAVGDARVWDGSKSVGLEDIASHTGAKVTVKYTESGGQKSATSIRLAATHAGKSGSRSK
jgi:phage baseplate assembly protein gpV